MKWTIDKVSTQGFFTFILLGLLVWESSFPWWKWPIYILTTVGITIRRKK